MTYVRSKYFSVQSIHTNSRVLIPSFPGLTLHSSMLNAYNIVGAEECMKDVEAALWQQAVREESKAPPAFFPLSFKTAALLHLEGELGLCYSDITAENCKAVYLNLIANL